jgi:hypothetical protein
VASYPEPSNDGLAVEGFETPELRPPTKQCFREIAPGAAAAPKL